MSHLIHFYFGDRIKAFETGLGTIIRAKGHSRKSEIIAFSDNFTWLNQMTNSQQFPVKIIDKTEITEFDWNAFETLLTRDNMVIMIANIDLFLFFRD